ncbi:MAG: hypothetical protein JWL60_2131 [Gemmatimonadetes bacterium]|nr:hypothetical protein [Gemmatimonadota bacterium]
MIATFAYLLFTTARNQVRTRLARLRNPRYAVAMLLGLAYLWFLYIRPSADRPGPVVMDGALGTTIVPLATLLFVAWTWLFGADRNALAFSQAEVTMLFAAPVSRRALVLYRIARTQLAILTTSIVWTFVFRQGGTVALAVTHLLAYWALLSTLNLNRLGVALVQSSGSAHGLRGLRRTWVPIALVVTALGTMAAALAAAWPAIAGAGSASAAVDAAAASLHSGPARWVLLPFRLLSAPLTARPGLPWLMAMGPAMLMLLGMAAWVLRTDAAFEESAAEASAAQARRVDALRSRRGAVTAAVTNRSRSIPLAPLGPPAVALLWKNAMWIMRTGQLRGLLAPPLIAALGLAAGGARSPKVAVFVGIASVVLAGVMLLLGPMSMRNDLRSELLHLSVLKTYPLRGRDVVLAEVGSSALPIAAMQYLLLLVGIAALGLARMPAVPPPSLRWAVALSLPLLLAALNGAVFMIHNGIALLLPGWSRLGPAAGAGVETLGLGMITIFFSVVVFLLLLAGPGVGAAVVVALLRERPALAVAAGLTTAGVLLLGEMVLCARLLGRALDRVEPMAVAG